MTAKLVGDDSVKLVIVKDSVLQSGRGLARALMYDYLKNDRVVHYVSLDVPEDDFFKNVDPIIKVNLHVYCGTLNPYGWEETSPDIPMTFLSDSQVLPTLGRLFDIDDAVVIIDSLSAILLKNSINLLCHTLFKLAFFSDSRIQQVVALLHSECHDGEVISMLEYYASALLTLEPHKNNEIWCSVVNKKKEGKIIRSLKKFSITNDLEIVNLENVEFEKSQENEQPKQEEVVSVVDHPLQNLSFKISLTEEEKIAKDQVVLPYTRKNPKGDGTIYYQPDEVDDIDEDDPDDDLCI